MNDILEDQKIHYIVKDYRRMYNSFWYLKGIIEEHEKSLKEKDKEILLLRAKINELKSHSDSVLPKGRLKGILNETESMTNSMKARLQQITSQTDRISNNVEELRQLINV